MKFNNLPLETSVDRPVEHREIPMNVEIRRVLYTCVLSHNDKESDEWKMILMMNFDGKIQQNIGVKLVARRYQH